MKISERLLQVMQKKNLNGKALARLCELPYPTWRQYLQGDRIPGGESLIKFSRHLRVNINWLLLGEGDMFLSDAPQSVSEPIPSYITDEQLLQILHIVSGMDQEDQKRVLIHCQDVEILSALRKERGLKKGAP